MEGARKYSVTKAFQRLPKHASYGCKRADVEDVLSELGIEPPFHSLHLGLVGIPVCARGGALPDVVQVAFAREYYNVHRTEWNDYRNVTRWLQVQIVPRKLVGRVREALRREGLASLLRWLDQRRSLPETALGRNHALYVEFVVADDSLRYRTAEANAGVDP